MIPGISIIVFLKCKDLGIRDAAARFCFGDLLYLGAGRRRLPEEPTGGWRREVEMPQDPTGAAH